MVKATAGRNADGSDMLVHYANGQKKPFREVALTEEIRVVNGRLVISKLVDDLPFVPQQGVLAKLDDIQLNKLKNKIHWNDQDNVLDVFVHSENNQYIVYIEGANGQLKRIDLAETDLAAEIRKIPGSEGKPIRLLSCSDLNSARELSKHVDNRVVYATEDIVVVYEDGGITTIARSGNSTQKWRKLKNGEDIGEAPIPGSKSKQGEAVVMGDDLDNIKKLFDKDILVKLESQAFFHKIRDLELSEDLIKALNNDFKINQDLISEFNNKSDLLEAWYVISPVKIFRSNKIDLKNVLKHITEFPNKKQDVIKSFNAAKEQLSNQVSKPLFNNNNRLKLFSDVAIKENFKANTPFSGVYDLETDKIYLHPSIDNKALDIPDNTPSPNGWIYRSAGHGKIAKIKGIKLGEYRINKKKAVAFTLILKEDHQFEIISWSSRGVNKFLFRDQYIASNYARQIFGKLKQKYNINTLERQGIQKARTGFEKK